MISNIYDLNIVNKTFDPLPFNIELENKNGTIQLIGNKEDLKPQQNYDAKILVMLPGNEIKKLKTPIKIAVYSEGKLLKQLETSFLAPVNKNNN